MMKSSSGGGKKKQPNAAIDEVEELLKLTQDDLLLKLTVNSHTKSKSKSIFDFIPESSSHSNGIEPDLERRFQALRSKPNPKSKTETSAADHEDVDNLFARFDALKAPNATASSNSSSVKIAKDESCDDVEDEEDEVQRIINWAVDAARLDPSPSSDIDDADDDEDDDSDDDDDVDSDDDDQPTDTADRKKKGPKVKSGNIK